MYQSKVSANLSVLLCLTETWWDETLAELTYLTVAFLIIMRAEREVNQHGWVAMKAKKLDHSNQKKGYECFFAVVYLWINVVLLYSISFQLRVKILNRMNLFLTAYPCSGFSFANIFDKILFMGDVNLPD